MAGPHAAFHIIDNQPRDTRISGFVEAVERGRRHSEGLKDISIDTSLEGHVASMAECSIEVTRPVLDEETQRATSPAHPARDNFGPERALVEVLLSLEDGHAVSRAIGPKDGREARREPIQVGGAGVRPVRSQRSPPSANPTPGPSTPTENRAR